MYQLATECHKTENNYIQLLESLNKEQINLKKTADSWSILDILEHVNIVESFRISAIEQALKNPTENIQNSSPSKPLQELQSHASQRTTFIQSPEYAIPTGFYKNIAEGLLLFKNNKTRFAKILSTHSEEALRAVVLEHKRLGNMNVLEWIAYLNGHAIRHYLQIQEILSA